MQPRIQVVGNISVYAFAGKFGFELAITQLDPFQGRGEPCWAVLVTDVLDSAGYCCGPDAPCDACEDRAMS